MPPLRILPAAEADIGGVLGNTLEEFGRAQFESYAELIEQALETLSEHPRAGRMYPEISPLASNAIRAETDPNQASTLNKTLGVGIEMAHPCRHLDAILDAILDAPRQGR